MSDEQDLCLGSAWTRFEHRCSRCTMHRWRGQIIKWKWVTLKVKSAGEAIPLPDPLTMRDRGAHSNHGAVRGRGFGFTDNTSLLHPLQHHCPPLSLAYISPFLVFSRSIGVCARTCESATPGVSSPSRNTAGVVCVTVASAFALFSFGPRMKTRGMAFTSVTVELVTAKACALFF